MFSEIIFFLSSVMKWKKLDPNFGSITSLRVFKKKLIMFIRPSPNSVFNCHRRKEIKYLLRLCIGLSQLISITSSILPKIVCVAVLMCIGLSTPHPQKHHPPLSCQATPLP